MNFSDLNQAQRIVIGIVACVYTAIFFLHNPLSGYTTSKVIETQKFLAPCSAEEKQKYREFLVGFYNSNEGRDRRESAEAFGGVDKEIDRSVNNCHLLAPGIPTDSRVNKELNEQALPFNEWQSNGSLVESLRSVVNFIYSMLFTTFVGSIFAFFVFRSNGRQIL